MSETLIGVTGAGGFIGSHLVEHLLGAGYRVRAMIRYSSHGDVGHLKHIPVELGSRLEIVPSDVRDAGEVERFLDGLTCCFHLAAVVSVPHSFLAPRSYFETNAEGTLHFLEAMRRRPGTRLVFASTSEVFGNNPQIPIGEEAPLLPCSPYAASKVAAERFVYAYLKSYPEVDAVIVRPFNTFGPRQSLRAVIPVIVQQALRGDVLHLGATDTRRDFLFVKDLAAFYERLIHWPRADNPIFNVGSGTDYSITDVVRLVGEHLGKKLTIHQDHERLRPTAAEVQRLLAQNDKVRSVLDWKPSHTFAEGLGEMVRWLRDHPEATSYRV
ncbi:MAG: GDP-mannose 4,6-dehydratase [Acidobacteriota bacterium]